MYKNLKQIVLDDGTRTDYFISNIGEVYNKENKKLYNSVNSNGYLKTSIRVNKNRIEINIHRFVSKHFCDDYKEELTVNHKDGNKFNNNYLNLESATIQENIEHAIVNGLRRNVLSDEEAYDIALMIKDTNEDFTVIAKKFNVNTKAIFNINSARTHQDISLKFISKNNGLIRSYKRPGVCKLTVNEVIQICELLEENYYQGEIAKIFDVAETTVSGIKTRKNWKDVSEDYNFENFSSKQTKLTENQVINISLLLMEGKINREIIEILNLPVNEMAISKIKNKARWKHITDIFDFDSIPKYRNTINRSRKVTNKLSDSEINELKLIFQDLVSGVLNSKQIAEKHSVSSEKIGRIKRREAFADLSADYVWEESEKRKTK